MIELTVIIIAQNEEVNISYCLQSVVRWAPHIYLVDGGSTDSTISLAKLFGVGVAEHAFQDWADQRNWALANLDITTEWVLFLDADEQVTAPLKREIELRIHENFAQASAYSIRQAFVFLGRHLKHAHDGPHLIRLVRHSQATWSCEGAREYCKVDGTTAKLTQELWHEDHRGLAHWIRKQNSNAQREARHTTFQRDEQSRAVPPSSDRLLRTWLRTQVYPLVPYQVRPLISFLFRYFINSGFLDGYPGFVFCFLHAFWYPLLADALVYEAKVEKHGNEVDLVCNLHQSSKL